MIKLFDGVIDKIVDTWRQIVLAFWGGYANMQLRHVPHLLWRIENVLYHPPRF